MGSQNAHSCVVMQQCFFFNKKQKLFTDAFYKYNRLCSSYCGTVNHVWNQ